MDKIRKLETIEPIVDKETLDELLAQQLEDSEL